MSAAGFWDNQERAQQVVAELKAVKGIVKPLEESETASGDLMTMLELAQQILRITGSQSEMVFKPLPGDDPRQRRPDIGLAASALQWKPSTELEAGLRATVDYFRELL